MCFSREYKFYSVNSPIDRAIIGFWGFGSNRRFSTMLRIGLWVFRAVFDEATCHLLRAPGGDMLTPIWQPLVFFCPQIMRMKNENCRTFPTLNEMRTSNSGSCVYGSFHIYFCGRQKCLSDWPQKWADKPVTTSHLSTDIHTFHCL